MSPVVHKSWDINEHATGRFKDGKPIMGATFQKGLNDIEPNGSFVSCSMKVRTVSQGVTLLDIERGRYGELRFADTSSANKHLCKIKYKDGNGISIKYQGGDSELPNVSNGKPTFNASNGIRIEHTPTYKGVKIELIVDDPLTAPTEHSFSIKTYGQEVEFVEQDGGIVARGNKNITIHAPFAVDANGDEGQVTMTLMGKVGGYMTFKKVVDEAWLRQAAAPVRIDPNVTIDDDSGTVIDALLSLANNTANYGLLDRLVVHKKSVGSQATSLIKVDLTNYTNITVISAHIGLDVYIKDGNSFETRLYEILKTWIEGTKTGQTALPGEPTWTSQVHDSNPVWSEGGCQGSGTDRAVNHECAVTVTGIDSDVQFSITNATVQDHIDNPSNNNGYVYISQDTTFSNAAWTARSSEAAIGNKPYFYMEWTEAAAAGRRRRMLIGRN